MKYKLNVENKKVLTNLNHKYQLNVYVDPLEFKRNFGELKFKAKIKNIILKITSNYCHILL